MIHEFKTYLVSIKGYSPLTAEAYEKDLRDFARWAKKNMSSARWSTIERKDIDRYIIDQVERGLKPATTNRRLSAISSLYDYMKRNGMEISNPCRYESRRKLAQTEPKTIDTATLKAAYKKSKGTMHLIIGILYQTGMRIQELLDLRKCDLNQANLTIRVMGKGSKERTCYILPELMADLVTFSQYRAHSQKIFLEWEQREVRYRLYEILRPMTNAPQVSPHAIRHTFATEVAKQGANVTTLAKMMGHRDIKTTQKYIDMAQTPINETYKNYHNAIMA